LGDRLYLCRAADLPAAIDLGERPSFLCTGNPPVRYLQNECNILIAKENLSIPDLLARVTELFHFYNTWELEMQRANSRNLPLAALGMLADPVFENPISLHNESMRYIFHIVNPDRYSVPDTYGVFKENEYIGLDDINTLKYENGFINAATKKEPAIYSSDHYECRSLYVNIFLSGNYAARLLIDEINREFTDRDFALLTVLGEAVKEGLQLKNAFNQWHPRRLDEILVKLLERHSVDEAEIKTVLNEKGWDVSDAYFCLTIMPSDLDIRGKTLLSLVDRIMALAPGNCCLIHNNAIVCLFNLSAIKSDRDTLQTRLFPCLRDSFLKAGISTGFSDFKNVYYYYQQTLIALRLGIESNQSHWYHRFDDYALEYIVETGTTALTPESLCPEGLLRLHRYDREQKTDYVHILRVYLENNMNAVQAQRKLYMHRNTFYSKLSRLKNILNMNLEDFTTRLYLMIAFRLIDKG
jgi:hypothetical protein